MGSFGGFAKGENPALNWVHVCNTHHEFCAVRKASLLPWWIKLLGWVSAWLSYPVDKLRWRVEKMRRRHYYIHRESTDDLLATEWADLCQRYGVDDPTATPATEGE